MLQSATHGMMFMHLTQQKGKISCLTSGIFLAWSSYFPLVWVHPQSYSYWRSYIGTSIMCIRTRLYKRIKLIVNNIHLRNFIQKEGPHPGRLRETRPAWAERREQGKGTTLLRRATQAVHRIMQAELKKDYIYICTKGRRRINNVCNKI